jgi:VanZ family protein
VHHLSPNFGPIVASVLWIVPVALAASGAVVVVSHRDGADRGTLVDRLAGVWLVASLVAVASLTLLPLVGGFADPRPSNLNPFSSIAARDAIDNVLLYVAVGFFSVLRWRGKPRPVVWATVFAFFVSFGVEAAQAILPIDRAASAHDVLFNTIGGLIGGVFGGTVLRLVRGPGRSTPTD